MRRLGPSSNLGMGGKVARERELGRWNSGWFSEARQSRAEDVLGMVGAVRRAYLDDRGIS